MKTSTVGFISAGAAGIVTAKALHPSGADVEVELFTRAGEHPLNRTLANEGVAIGLLKAHQAAPPMLGVQPTAYTVRDHLARASAARVLLFGGGLVPSETASLPTDTGDDTALIIRTLIPSMSTIGEPKARRLLALHQPRTLDAACAVPTASALVGPWWPAGLSPKVDGRGRCGVSSVGKCVGGLLPVVGNSGSIGLVGSRRT